MASQLSIKPSEEDSNHATSQPQSKILLTLRHRKLGHKLNLGRSENYISNWIRKNLETSRLWHDGFDRMGS